MEETHLVIFWTDWKERNRVASENWDLSRQKLKSIIF